jgi:hypothetical protein
MTPKIKFKFMTPRNKSLRVWHQQIQVRTMTLRTLTPTNESNYNDIIKKNIKNWYTK